MEIYSPNQMAQIYTAMFQELLVVPCGENHMHAMVWPAVLSSLGISSTGADLGEEMITFH